MDALKSALGITASTLTRRYLTTYTFTSDASGLGSGSTHFSRLAYNFLEGCNLSGCIAIVSKISANLNMEVKYHRSDAQQLRFRVGLAGDSDIYGTTLFHINCYNTGSTYNRTASFNSIYTMQYAYASYYSAQTDRNIAQFRSADGTTSSYIFILLNNGTVIGTNESKFGISRYQLDSNIFGTVNFEIYGLYI